MTLCAAERESEGLGYLRHYFVGVDDYLGRIIRLVINL